jgi:hypothetical protein
MAHARELPFSGLASNCHIQRDLVDSPFMAPPLLLRMALRGDDNVEGHTLTSEWADWTDASIPDMDAVAERQRFESYVSTLWREMKDAIVTSIASVNKRLPAESRIDCADSPGEASR